MIKSSTPSLTYIYIVFILLDTMETTNTKQTDWEKLTETQRYNFEEQAEMRLTGYTEDDE